MMGVSLIQILPGRGFSLRGGVWGALSHGYCLTAKPQQEIYTCRKVILQRGIGTCYSVVYIEESISSCRWNSLF